MVQHLLGIEGLPKESMLGFLSAARNFKEVLARDLKKVPPLRGKTIINLFLEPSTRTRASFEIAGKILSADTINISGSESSERKGETLLDTARTLEAMNPDIIVIRHKESGAPHFLAKYLDRAAIVNAGDGTHEHPSQALLDLLTLQEHFEPLGRGIEGLRIAVVGDVHHSRVARSNIYAHLLLGNDVRLVGPPALVPRDFIGSKAFGDRITLHHDLSEGIAGADVVMCLRMQLERQVEHFVPTQEEYNNEYGINEKVLKRCAPQAVILHPGPANRGVEISSEVLDGPRSLFRKQVNNGVALRMAVLFQIATGSARRVQAEVGA